MKALFYEGPNRMHVADLPEPSPAAGEVKLRVGACGICGSDVHGYTGQSGRRVPGMVMGHEFAGEIVELGSGVDGWKTGQRVTAFNIIGCDECPHCASGNSQRCPHRKVIGVNMGTIGAYAEYICMPAKNLAELADGVSYADGLLHEPLTVAYHALGHVPQDAQSLAIVGGGTIGQGLVMVAQALGDRKVFLLEPLAEKRALAEQHGAAALPPDLNELVKHLPDGADAAMEAVGIEAAFQLALDAIHPSGTLVLVGNLAKQVPLPLQHVTSTEKHLVGSYGFNLGDFQRIMSWINEGRFDLTPFLSGSCTLEEAPQVFADLAAGRRQALKIVVEP